MNDSDPEVMRKKYLYRRLILQGKIRISHDAARRLIGPDCAYHLYSTYGIPPHARGTIQTRRKD